MQTLQPFSGMMCAMKQQRACLRRFRGTFVG